MLNQSLNRKFSDLPQLLSPVWGNAPRRFMQILLVIFILCVLPLHGQAIYGTLLGTVTDSSGALVPNATIVVTNQATGVASTIQSNADGLFNINTLQPGTYTVRASASGFQSSEAHDIVIHVNSPVRLDERLSLAANTQNVTVTSAPPALQTERADVNYEISTEMVSSLPTTSSTAARQFQGLYKLVPGATPPAEQNSAGSNPQRGEATNVNGAPNTTNSTRLDGAVNSYAYIPYVIAYVPPPDAIDSVNFATSSFTAEQGMAGGAAVNVIIKTGSNNFHGSVFEYNSSTGYNAKTWGYVGSTVPKNISNEFGGSIGGRILRDKLFFFADFDKITQRKTLSGYFTIPDKNSALARGNFSGTGTTIYNPATGNANGTGRMAFAGDQVPVSSVAAMMIALLPNPTNSNATNNYYATTSYQFDRYNMDYKITYNPTSRSSVFGRYSISPDTIVDPFALGAAEGLTVDNGQPGTAQGRAQNVGLGFTYAFTSNFLVDGNAGYNRQFIQIAPDDLNVNYGSDVLQIPGTNGGADPLYGGIPFFSFGVGYSSLGNAYTSNPTKFRDNQYSGNLNGSYLKGLHNFRFGGEYTHAALNQFQPQGAYGPRGGFASTGGITSLNGGASTNMYNALADFMLGDPQNLGKATQIENPNALRFSGFAFYAQDQFQASQRLTLTYGLRYEYYPFLTRDHYGAFRYDPVSGNVLIGGQGGVPNDTGENVGWGMIVPRFGANYRVAENTVVRAGFGMTVDPDNFRFLRDSYPAVILQAFSGASSFTPAGCLNSGSYVPLNGCTVTGIPGAVLPNLSLGTLPLPSTVGTNTVPQTFRRPYLYSYNVAVQQQFPAHFVSTLTYVGMREVRQVSSVDINASPVGTGNAGRPLNIAHGQTADIYSMLPFGSTNYNGMQAQVSNRAKRDAQFGIVYTWSRTMDVSDNSIYGSPYFGDPAFYGRNYAAAGYDHTNNLQIWTILASPFGRGQKYFQHGVVAYALGGWQLSTVVSKVSGAPFTVTASSSSLNAPGSSQTADLVKSKVAIYGAHSPNHIYFDTTAFAPVTAVRYGTSGRNSLRGPGSFQMDASLFRSIPIWRELEFKFGAEAFDITNTPTFNSPGNNVSSPSSFGLITSASVNRTLRLSGRIQF
jgi:hypothetical protein